MGLKQDFIKVVDATVGRALCRMLGQHAVHTGAGPRDAVGAPDRVLVIRPGGIGDAVLVVPMLKRLRQEWPDAKIDLLLERRNVSVITETGIADNIFLYDAGLTTVISVIRRGYDLVVDTEQHHRLSALVAYLTRAPTRIGFGSNNRRRLLTRVVPYSQSLYEVYSFLELAAAATGRSVGWDPEQPFFPISTPADEYAERALAAIANRRMVAIHPGASIPERRWARERYAELARMLAEDELAIVVLGGPGDRDTADFISAAIANFPHVNLAGACTLPHAAAVVARVEVYVSADSGVLHLAYGVGTPTVHLFGPGVLSKWAPAGARFRTVEHPVPCSPCTRYGYTPPCCQGLVCMRGITPATVYQAVREQLAAERPQSSGEMAAR